MVTFDGYRLQNELLDDVIAEAERALRVTVEPNRRTYGTQGATVGYPTTCGTWLRLAWRAPHEVHADSWTGVELASTIIGVAKPALFRSYRWIDETRNVVWRADEAELVTALAIHPSGVLDVDPELTETWWDGLASSLASLAAVDTIRITMGQAHLTRRIDQVFGDRRIDTTITEWATAHGDLHFGNLTAPDCILLDWQDWGRGPRGLDVATLWGHSLLVPVVAERIQTRFSTDLRSRTGRLAQLLFCANVIRLNTNKPSASPLLRPAIQASERLLEQLSTDPDN